jgi:hypothetical protein
MARVWMVLPGGRIKPFKRPQVKHDCRRRRRGRPAVGVGPCYPLNIARQARRVMNRQLRRAVREAESLEEVFLIISWRRWA